MEIAVKPKPERPYRVLDVFVGKWKTSGMVKTEQGTLPVSGTDTYSWLPGGYVLLHQVDVVMGGARQQSLEVIGYDSRNEWYTMQSFDEQGQASNMRAFEKDGSWKFVSDAIRFSGNFSGDNAIISGEWEKLEDGTWQLLMDIRLTRILD